MTEADKKFYDMADEHIALSNQQLSNSTMGEVSASMLFSLARFNAWISSAGWNNGKEMEEAKQETIDYFVERYKKLLTESLDEYIRNFDNYKNNKK